LDFVHTLSEKKKGTKVVTRAVPFPNFQRLHIDTLKIHISTLSVHISSFGKGTVTAFVQQGAL